MFEQGEDMFFDAKEYHSSNKHVANILSEKPKEEVPVEQIQEAVLDDMDAAWVKMTEWVIFSWKMTAL